jgi:hypothetical protein
MAGELSLVSLTHVICQLSHLGLQLGDCLGVHHGGVSNITDGLTSHLHEFFH